MEIKPYSLILNEYEVVEGMVRTGIIPDFYNNNTGILVNRLFRYFYELDADNAIDLLKQELDKLDILYEDECGYAIHISNLEIFYEPLDLEKAGIYKDNGYRTKMVTKAPQNMQYVNDIFGRECVLISIRPEWVEKILNGEKTIEVRRVVVNQLKNLIGV